MISQEGRGNQLGTNFSDQFYRVKRQGTYPSFDADTQNLEN